MYTDDDRTMALAGVYQTAHLAQQIAHRGMSETQAMTTSIGSLFKIDAPSVNAVYEGVRGISTGLHLLRDQLSGAGKRDAELTRYVISLIQLERKLSKQPTMLETVRRGIAEAAERLEHFSLLHPNVLSALADIYKQTLSTLQPRIMVKGDAPNLQNTENINKIRSLLLAGIRSAMLWRQVGGTRMQIVFQRKKLEYSVNNLLERSENSDH